METLKHLSFTKLIMFFALLGVTATFYSCKDSDDDEPGQNELVGTWYYYDDEDDELDYDDYFEFKSNGKMIYSGDETGTYKYDSKSSILTLKYEYGLTERLEVEFISKNLIEIEDFGMYKRR